MSRFFEVVNQAKQGSKLAADALAGRDTSLRLGIVSKNLDPQGQRRIRVTTAAKGGTIESDWLRRVDLTPHRDVPVPEIGQTVLVGFIDSDPHKGVYLGLLTNDVNPPQDKQQPLLDHTEQTPGQHVLNVEKDIVLQTSGGARITLEKGGNIVLEAGDGTTLMLGGDATLNGKSVTTLDALDNKGDKLVTKGWS